MTCPSCGGTCSSPLGFTKTVLAVACIGLGLAFNREYNKPSDGDSPRYGAVNAQTECERYVRQSLQAPSSTDFAPPGELSISGEGVGPWVVKGWIDAQNSSGTRFRSTYTCEIEFSGESAILRNLSIP